MIFDDIDEQEENEDWMPKDLDKGKDVKNIAKSCRIDEELADRICRMYLTHPGIDIDGIITRIS